MLTEAEIEARKKEADWEPAGKLLERITAEKTKQAEIAKQTKRKRKPKQRGTSK